MINFQLSHTLNMLWLLENEKSSLSKGPPKNQDPNLIVAAAIMGSDPWLTDKAKKGLRSLLESTKQYCDELHLEKAQHRLSLFIRRVDYSTYTEAVSELKVLLEAIESDLSRCRFYLYPEKRIAVLTDFTQQWSKIIVAFPLTKLEALAAIDCYALDHHTACVFHMMRAAEHGLRAVAKERKIKLPSNRPVEWGNWQEIIKGLTDEAAKIGKTKRAGNTKDNALAFYSGAIADLNAFKDEYRNQVMHVRKPYDEHQALRAITNVQAFMERLSAKIDHKHTRIKWRY